MRYIGMVFSRVEDEEGGMYSVADDSGEVMWDGCAFLGDCDGMVDVERIGELVEMDVVEVVGMDVVEALVEMAVVEELVETAVVEELVEIDVVEAQAEVDVVEELCGCVTR